jgi:hypothetical protein
MALPFLPANMIPREFERIKDVADGAMPQLFDYVESNWIQASLWKPAVWSGYGKAIRTNNDVEGWHRRVNHKAKKGQLPFYLMIQLLRDEASKVDLHARLVSRGKLTRYQRRTYRGMQKRIFEYWDEYVAGTRTATQLLEACSYLVAF